MRFLALALLFLTPSVLSADPDLLSLHRHDFSEGGGRFYHSMSGQRERIVFVDKYGKKVFDEPGTMVGEEPRNGEDVLLIALYHDGPFLTHEGLLITKEGHKIPLPSIYGEVRNHYPVVKWEYRYRTIEGRKYLLLASYYINPYAYEEVHPVDRVVLFDLSAEKSAIVPERNLLGRIDSLHIDSVAGLRFYNAEEAWMGAGPEIEIAPVQQRPEQQEPEPRPPKKNANSEEFESLLNKTLLSNQHAERFSLYKALSEFDVQGYADAPALRRLMARMMGDLAGIYQEVPAFEKLLPKSEGELRSFADSLLKALNKNPMDLTAAAADGDFSIFFKEFIIKSMLGLARVMESNGTVDYSVARRLAILAARAQPDDTVINAVNYCQKVFVSKREKLQGTKGAQVELELLVSLAHLSFDATPAWAALRNPRVDWAVVARASTLFADDMEIQTRSAEIMLNRLHKDRSDSRNRLVLKMLGDIYKRLPSDSHLRLAIEEALNIKASVVGTEAMKNVLTLRFSAEICEGLISRANSK